MELEVIVLSEISQAERQVPQAIHYTWGQKKLHLMEVENRMVGQQSLGREWGSERWWKIDQWVLSYKKFWCPTAQSGNYR
jgi:hypothetical protein